MFSNAAKLALRNAINENLRIQETLLTSDKADIVCTDVSLGRRALPLQIVSTWTIMGYAPGQKSTGLSLYLPLQEDPDLIELFTNCIAITYNPVDITKIKGFECGVFYEDPAAEGCFFAMSTEIKEFEKLFMTVCERFFMINNTSTLKFKTWTSSED